MTDNHPVYNNNLQIAHNDLNSRFVSFRFYETVYGSEGDNIIYANGDSSTFKEGWSAQGTTIYGISGNNLLYGRQGNDTIYGGTDDDIIFGGSGNNHLYAGGGNNLIYGGEGNDHIYGGDGDDWLFTGSLEGGASNVLSGGGGANTFVIGKVPEAQEFTETFNFGGWLADFSLGLTKDVLELSFMLNAPHAKVAKTIVPHAIEFVKGLFSIGSEEVVTVDPPKASYTQITDFNPLDDVVLIPLNPDGPLNIFLDDATNTENAIVIKNVDDEGQEYVLATISWADAQDIYGPEVTHLHPTAQKAFLEALMQSAMVIGESGAIVDLDKKVPLDVDASLLEGLGTGRFLVMGAYSGQVLQGSNGADYLFGNNGDDIIAGYALDPTGGISFAPELAGDNELRGFGGDDVFFGGGGNDYIYGGTGNNTSSYIHSHSGIVANLSNIDTDANGTYALIEDDGFGTWDKLYNIQNIIGSDHDDIIHGDENDNILVSGDGDDELKGAGGANTFLLNGGTNTILDFDVTSGDVLRLSPEDYGFLSTRDLEFMTPDADGTAFIKVNSSGEVIAVLEDMHGSAFILDEHVDIIGVTEGTDGDDLFEGGQGGHTYVGFHGTDTISYAKAGLGIEVDLSKTKSEAHGDFVEVTLANGLTDRLYSVENVVGSDMNDVIIGDDGDNVLTSGDGNDFLDGSGGTNTYVLNGGTNTVAFSMLEGDMIRLDKKAYGVSSHDEIVALKFFDVTEQFPSYHLYVRGEMVADLKLDHTPVYYEARELVELI